MGVKVIPLLSAVRSSCGVPTSCALLWVPPYFKENIMTMPCVTPMFPQSGDGTGTSCMFGRFVTAELHTPGPLPDNLKV